MGLDVGGKDLRVLGEVNVERITGPSPFGLHGLEGEATKHVLQHGSNAYAVALERLETCLECRCPHDFEEFRLGEWSVCAVVAVGEEVCLARGVIDCYMVVQSCARIGGALLGSPENVFAVQLGFCAGDGEDHDVIAIAVRFLSDPGRLDVMHGVEILEGRYGEFAEPCCSVEGGGEACIRGCMQWGAEVELISDLLNVFGSDGLALLALRCGGGFLLRSSEEGVEVAII